MPSSSWCKWVRDEWCDECPWVECMCEWCVWLNEWGECGWCWCRLVGRYLPNVKRFSSSDDLWRHRLLLKRWKDFFGWERRERMEKSDYKILTNFMKNIVYIINLNSRRCSLSFLTYVPVRWFATCCRTFETIMPFCFGLRHADIFRSTWTHVSWWMMF